MSRDEKTPEQADDEGTPKRYWRVRLTISAISVCVALIALLTRMPRFFIELEEWSGISVHEQLGIEKPADLPQPVSAEGSAEAAPAIPISTDPAPNQPGPAPTSSPTPPPPPAKPDRDPTFTYALTRGGKKHIYWYGPPDAVRATRVRTKLVGTALWSEFRQQAFTIDAVLDDETRLLVSKAIDANADQHLTLSELTVARRRGLMGLLQGH